MTAISCLSFPYSLYHVNKIDGRKEHYNLRGRGVYLGGTMMFLPETLLLPYFSPFTHLLTGQNLKTNGSIKYSSYQQMLVTTNPFS